MDSTVFPFKTAAEVSSQDDSMAKINTSELSISYSNKFPDKDSVKKDIIMYFCTFGICPKR
ncbi:hypothetical protein CAPN006_17620 [Capnocytophaga canimorsus]|nr:hypothetical protein CAPN006_17620 [Capnocytophaga canimorsus]GIM59016.1 hypothetical protein CAPN007_12240 [Capnocytophaga canimorsus]